MLLEKSEEEHLYIDYPDIQEAVREISYDKERLFKLEFIPKRFEKRIMVDFSLKKTYLSTSQNDEDAIQVLLAVTRYFCLKHRGTATMYTKGNEVCLECITPVML